MSTSTLLYLDGNDFELREWDKKKVFSLMRPTGLVLVYFFMPQCSFCETFTPFFYKLPQVLKGGIQFAVVNAKNSIAALKLSNQSTTPITEVPYVLLYHNGWPVERYTGPADLSSIKSFLETTVRARLSNTTPTTAEGPITPPDNISNSKNPYKVCYLSYGEAYKGKATLMSRTP